MKKYKQQNTSVISGQKNEFANRRADVNIKKKKWACEMASPGWVIHNAQFFYLFML
jgi:hypothetical protein